MMVPPESRRIFWMLRLLAAVGLTTIIFLIWLVGRQIGSLHAERSKLDAEQERLYRTSEEILRRSAEAGGRIIGILEGQSQAGKADAAGELEAMIDGLIGSTNQPFAPTALQQLDVLSTQQAQLERRALIWRTNYDTAFEDVGQQRTLGRARDQAAVLRGAVETLQGQQRLQTAIQVKRWRAASGAEAARLAEPILAEQDSNFNLLTADLEWDLAEIESEVEQLGGEEQPDNLPNLKDNKLTPALARLGYDIKQLGAVRPDNGALTARAVEGLTATLFGEGYRKDQAHQAIQVGTNGLYALRRDMLRLRSERERFSQERSRLSHEIDAAARLIIVSARTQSETLAGRVESNLAASWWRMMLAGAGCAALFFWLGWLISRAIRRQVGVIERAKSEAESGRRTAQLLIREREQVELALRESEERLRQIFEHSAQVFYAHGIDGRLTYVSPQAKQFFDCDPAEALQPWTDFLTDNTVNAAGIELTRRAIETGQAQRPYELQLKSKQGRIVWVEVHESPVVVAGRTTAIVGALANITERKDLHQQLVEASRRGGMAEIATNVLHNVGNVLNSVNVSTGLLVASVRKSKAASLGKIVDLLREHADDLGTYLTTDSRGKHVPAFLGKLAEQLMSEQAAMVDELDSLSGNVEHIKEIVVMQQTYATFGGVKETVNVADIVEDSLRMTEGALRHHGVEIIREFGKVPPMTIERHKVLQVLVNLLRNAKHACQESDRADKRLTVRVANGDGRVRISVQDNGVGIPAEILTRIFNHGFTTRKTGHGFGLHSGALTAKELAGSLTVQSDGPGHGATFTLELPCPAPEAPRITNERVASQEPA